MHKCSTNNCPIFVRSCCRGQSLVPVLMMGCLSLALELNEKSQTGAMLPSAGERENQSG